MTVSEQSLIKQANHQELDLNTPNLELALATNNLKESLIKRRFSEKEQKVFFGLLGTEKVIETSYQLHWSQFVTRDKRLTLRSDFDSNESSSFTDYIVSPTGLKAFVETVVDDLTLELKEREINLKKQLSLVLARRDKESQSLTENLIFLKKNLIDLEEGKATLIVEKELLGQKLETTNQELNKTKADNELLNLLVETLKDKKRSSEDTVRKLELDLNQLNKKVRLIMDGSGVNNHFQQEIITNEERLQNRINELEVQLEQRTEDVEILDLRNRVLTNERSSLQNELDFLKIETFNLKEQVKAKDQKIDNNYQDNLSILETNNQFYKENTKLTFLNDRSLEVIDKLQAEYLVKRAFKHWKLKRQHQFKVKSLKAQLAKENSIHTVGLIKYVQNFIAQKTGFNTLTTNVTFYSTLLLIVLFFSWAFSKLTVYLFSWEVKRNKVLEKENSELKAQLAKK